MNELQELLVLQQIGNGIRDIDTITSTIPIDKQSVEKAINDFLAKGYILENNYLTESGLLTLSRKV